MLLLSYVLVQLEKASVSFGTSKQQLTVIVQAVEARHRPILPNT
jgi:hypothetical protein